MEKYDGVIEFTEDTTLGDFNKIIEGWGHEYGTLAKVTLIDNKLCIEHREVPNAEV